MSINTPTDIAPILRDMGARIRLMRLQRQITQSALVLKTSLSIAAIEQGNCDISVGALVAIAQVLECNACELLPGGMS